MHTTNPNTSTPSERSEIATDREEQRENRISTAQLANAAEHRPEADTQPVQPRPEDRAERPALFEGDEGGRFRGRWGDIQASFVDEPRKAVESADELVAEVMQRLAQQFASERQHLEQQWDRGGETDTEALRQALRRYRSFFDRLLAF